MDKKLQMLRREHLLNPDDEQAYIRLRSYEYSLGLITIFDIMFEDWYSTDVKVTMTSQAKARATVTRGAHEANHYTFGSRHSLRKEKQFAHRRVRAWVRSECRKMLADEDYERSFDPPAHFQLTGWCIA